MNNTVHLGDHFVLIERRADGTSFKRWLVYLDQGGQPCLWWDYSAWLPIAPEDLQRDLDAGVLRDHPGALHKVYDKATGERDDRWRSEGYGPRTESSDGGDREDWNRR